MEKMKMHSYSRVDANVKKMEELFPHCVTEVINDDGNLERVIDFDALKEEFSTHVVDGKKERYQFTWPDKNKAKALLNQDVTSTLRPCRKESVDFDSTENLYIEGDNLEVLKLLQETYLGKIKMIYIDPPYNTGSDFVYEDDFSTNAEDYKGQSGEYNSVGDRLVTNLESNGRFHTDWLNMMYPRLKIARDLLREDGAIFISIDDHEVNNMLNMCNEIFGNSLFVGIFPWRKRTAKSDVPFGVSQDYEWVICYAKSISFKCWTEGKERKYFVTEDFPTRPWRVHDLTSQRTAAERPNSFFTMVNPKTGEEFPANPNRTWAVTKDTFDVYYKENRIVFPGDYKFLKISKPALRYWKDEDIQKAGDNFGKIAVSTKFPDYIGMSLDGTKEITNLFGSKVFPFPKPTSLIKYLSSICTDSGDIVLDFFSGSASSAGSIFELNAEDQGRRRFILVQLPEECDAKSDAFKAGYKTICDIGIDRIKRAGTKVKEDNPLTASDLDIGFRVLKLDSSNMNDIYYKPSEYSQDMLAQMESNIKLDRTPEDLLFQIMLDLGVELSSKIDSFTIKGKEVFNVAEGWVMACFDEDVSEDVIIEVAKQKPRYFVMRDSSMAHDTVSVNFDEIFNRYSPETIRKVM